MSTKGADAKSDVDGSNAAYAAAQDVVVKRRARKTAISRHLGTLSRHMTEGNVALVHERLKKLSTSFNEFDLVNEMYLETLTEEDDFDKSESWFAEVEYQQHWTSGICSDQAQGIHQ